MLLGFRNVAGQKCGQRGTGSLAPGATVKRAFCPNVGHVRTTVNIVSASIPSAFRSPFNGAPRISSRVRPVMYQRHSIVQLLMGRFEFTKVQYTKREQSICVLNQSNNAITTAMGPYNMNVCVIVRLVPRDSIRFVSIIRLTKVPIKVGVDGLLRTP